MSSLSARRLAKELQMLSKDPPPSIAAWMVDDNTHKLRAQMVGPADSPFHNGTFQLELSIPQSYPIDPPSVHFLTPILHPNVDERGRICLSLLSLPPKGSWSPAITLAALLLSIHQLLAYPNGSDGLVRDVTELYNADRAEWERRARDWTRRFALQQDDQQQHQQQQHGYEQKQHEQQRPRDASRADQSEKVEAAAAIAAARQEDAVMPVAAAESDDATADDRNRKRMREEEASASLPAAAAGSDAARIEEDAAPSPSNCKRSRET